MSAPRIAVLLLGCVLATSHSVWSQDPETFENTSLLQSGKLAFLEENWSEALRLFRELQRRTRRGRLYSEAVLFEAKTLEQQGVYEEALTGYQDWLRANPNHVAEADTRYSVVDLAVTLYQNGNKRYIDLALRALQSENVKLKHLAAIRLSHVKDKQITDQVIPVLRSIVQTTEDSELRNQALLGILRMDPAQGSSLPTPPSKKRPGKQFRLTVIEEGEITLQMTLDLSLARMLLAALPEDAQEELRKKGIRVDNLIEVLEEAGEIIEIKTRDSTVRIWIE